MSPDIHNRFQDFLNKHRDGLTDAQIDDFYDQFLDLRDAVEERADCGHENVVAHIPPEYVERPCLTPEMETGSVAVFRGKCEDCGARVDTSLEITAHTEGDDDE